MKICLLSAKFPPKRCGVGDYSYFLSRALGAIGYEVDVLTSEGESNEALYPLSQNVRVHRVIASWGFRGLPHLTSYLRKLSPEVLLIQYVPHAFDRRGITFAVNVLPALLRTRSHLRVITNFHELHIPFGYSTMLDAASIWQRGMAVLLASGSHSISVTAREWRRRLLRMGVRRRAELIPVGSNIPQVHSTNADRLNMRNQLFGDSNGLLLAGFGSGEDRDLEAAMYGLAELRRHRPAKLVWIGRDPFRGHGAHMERAVDPEALQERGVQLVGELPHPEVSKLLGICDLMILPFTDGISTRRTSAVTALQHGLPLLTTASSSSEPMFSHRKNVYLVPIGDRPALAEGLLELGFSDELRAKLSSGARILYNTHFRWDAVAERVSQLLEGGNREPTL